MYDRFYLLIEVTKVPSSNPSTHRIGLRCRQPFPSLDKIGHRSFWDPNSSTLVCNISQIWGVFPSTLKSNLSRDTPGSCPSLWRLHPSTVHPQDTSRTALASDPFPLDSPLNRNRYFAADWSLLTTNHAHENQWKQKIVDWSLSTIRKCSSDYLTAFITNLSIEWASLQLFLNKRFLPRFRQSQLGQRAPLRATLLQHLVPAHHPPLLVMLLLQHIHGDLALLAKVSL